MPRRAMLPYPSTSRRLCAAARCPKITTIALVSILLACLYNSRTLLSKDQPTLSRVVNSGPPRTVLEPAVEVVKEVVDKSDTGILGFAQRDTSDGIQTVYNNIPGQPIKDQPLSVDERPMDVNAVSVTDLETNSGQKDLVGLIADAQKHQTEPAVSVDMTGKTVSVETVTSETVASGAEAGEVVEHTKDQISVTPPETLPTVEKTDEETLSDAATTTLEGASVGTAIDSAERTDEADSATATDVLDGEALATEKQEDVDKTSTTTETVTSQSDLTGGDTEVLTVEKQESADEAQIASKDVDGAENKVLIAEKQESSDESAEAEAFVDGEEATSFVKTAGKDVGESSETEEIETTDKQEKEEAVVVEDASDTTERAEIDPATVTKAGNVDGQEAVEDGLDAADKQDAVDSGETDAGEMISDSEKQTENAEEAVKNSEIIAAEKQEEVESDTAVLDESEKEKVEAHTSDKTEAVDGAVGADLSVADKMKDEQSTEKEGEDIDTAIHGGYDIDAADKQDRLSETEAVTREEDYVSETTVKGELDTAEKQKGDEATSMQEAQGDYDLSKEEKQEVEVPVDGDTAEKADEEKTGALQ